MAESPPCTQHTETLGRRDHRQGSDLEPGVAAPEARAAPGAGKGSASPAIPAATALVPARRAPSPSPPSPSQRRRPARGEGEQGQLPSDWTALLSISAGRGSDGVEGGARPGVNVVARHRACAVEAGAEIQI